MDTGHGATLTLLAALQHLPFYLPLFIYLLFRGHSFFPTLIFVCALLFPAKFTQFQLMAFNYLSGILHIAYPQQRGQRLTSCEFCIFIACCKFLGAALNLKFKLFWFRAAGRRLRWVVMVDCGWRLCVHSNLTN